MDSAHVELLESFKLVKRLGKILIYLIGPYFVGPYDGIFQDVHWFCKIAMKIRADEIRAEIVRF